MIMTEEMWKELGFDSYEEGKISNDPNLKRVCYQLELKVEQGSSLREVVEEMLYMAQWRFRHQQWVESGVPEDFDIQEFDLGEGQ